MQQEAAEQAKAAAKQRADDARRAKEAAEEKARADEAARQAAEVGQKHTGISSIASACPQGPSECVGTLIYR